MRDDEAAQVLINCGSRACSQTGTASLREQPLVGGPVAGYTIADPGMRVLFIVRRVTEGNTSPSDLYCRWEVDVCHSLHLGDGVVQGANALDRGPRGERPQADGSSEQRADEIADDLVRVAIKRRRIDRDDGTNSAHKSVGDRKRPEPAFAEAHDVDLGLLGLPLENPLEGVDDVIAFPGCAALRELRRDDDESRDERVRFVKFGLGLNVGLE